MDNALDLSPLEQTLEGLICHADLQDDYATATWLAEQLFALLTVETRPWIQREHGYYRLAKSLFRQQKYSEVRKLIAYGGDVQLLETSIRCRFKLALACHHLKLFVEAGSVVDSLLNLMPADQSPLIDFRDKQTEPGKEGNPHRSRVLSLRGVIARAQGIHSWSRDSLEESLKGNPFCWETIRNLAEMGKLDSTTMFETFFANNKYTEMESTGIPPKPLAQGSNFMATINQSKTSAQTAPVFHRGSTLSASSSSSSSSSVNTATSAVGRTTVKRGNAAVARKTFERALSINSVIGSKEKADSKRGLGRSSTSANLIQKHTSMKSALQPSSQKLAVIVASMQEFENHPSPSTPNTLTQSPLSTTLPMPGTVERTEWSFHETSELIGNMAGPYALLCKNEFSESETRLQKLPPGLMRSPWVLRQLAKCRFGLSDYKQAIKYFEVAFDKGWSVEDTGLYSTCFWQLRKPFELAKLSMDAEDLDFRSPETCCVVGNKFSLKGDHTTALKYFKRAIFVDRLFTYAYTLAGHEFLELEELEEAAKHFQSAIANDPRHYNAWYGLGLVEERLQKYEYALVRFRNASHLSPRTSIIVQAMARTHERLKRYSDALQAYGDALVLDPKNPMAGYQRAKILYELERFEDADKQLAEVEKLAPDVNVHLLQGRVKISLGEREPALRYFGLVQSLDIHKRVKNLQKLVDRAMEL